MSCYLGVGNNISILCFRKIKYCEDKYVCLHRNFVDRLKSPGDRWLCRHRVPKNYLAVSGPEKTFVERVRLDTPTYRYIIITIVHDTPCKNQTTIGE